MKKFYWQFFGLALAWGSSFSLIKIALDSFSPLQIAFLRSFVGFGVLFAWCLIGSIKIPAPSMLWLHLGILSLLLNTLPNFLFAYAETHVSSTLAGLINATTPLITVALVAVILRSEKLDRSQLGGVLLGFLGILLLIEVWNGSKSDSNTALLALFGAVLCFSISYPYINKYLRSTTESSEALIAIQLGISSLSFFPFLLMHKDFAVNPAPESIISILALGIFASGFAYVWNIKVTQALGSTFSSSVSYLIPAVALISGFIFMGETANKFQISGLILVFFSIWFTGRKVSK